MRPVEFAGVERRDALFEAALRDQGIPGPVLLPGPQAERRGDRERQAEEDQADAGTAPRLGPDLDDGGGRLRSDGRLVARAGRSGRAPRLGGSTSRARDGSSGGGPTIGPGTTN